jgi:hypothetical protein
MIESSLLDGAFLLVFISFLFSFQIRYGIEDRNMEHNPEGTTVFFFVTNTIFILIMSQFLIAGKL